MWKVKNISKDPRKFREFKTASAHFLRPSEEVTISNQPATNRTDVFEITEIKPEEESKETEELAEPNRDERRKKK